MARVKNGAVTKARHKKIIKAASGYFGSKHTLYKTAKEQLMHSGQYAFRDRKNRKRDFRKLWITRINAACRMNDISYSKFISGLNKAGVEVNRKMLSEIAINDEKAFAEFVAIAKKGLEGKATVAAKAETKGVIVTPAKEEKAAKKETKKVEEEKVEEKTKKATTKKTTTKKESTKAETEEKPKKTTTRKTTKKETK